MSAAEVDAAVSAQVGSGLSLYTLDEARIAELAPDVIVTQQLCPVCAVSTEQVDGAVRPLPRCPELVSLDPRTLGDVFADIRRVGEVTGRTAEAEALLADLDRRLAAVRATGSRGGPARACWRSNGSIRPSPAATGCRR